MSTAVTYAERSAAASVHSDVNVVSLRIARNASAQLSELPDGRGFLIRAWGPNKTHEFGGDNSNALSVTIRFDPETERPILDSINFWGDA